MRYSNSEARPFRSALRIAGIVAALAVAQTVTAQDAMYEAEIIGPADFTAGAFNDHGHLAGGVEIPDGNSSTLHAAIPQKSGSLNVFSGLPFSFLSELSNTGIAAGRGESFAPNGTFQNHLVRYRPGLGFDVPVTLPMPSGAMELVDINDSGAIAFDAPDHSLDDFSFTRGFFYRDDTGLISLGVLNQEDMGYSTVGAMNADDVVVGFATYRATDGALRSHAFRWSIDEGLIDMHPGGEMDYSVAKAINDSGQIVGHVTISGVGSRAWRHTDGVGVEIIHPTGSEFAVETTSARAVNGRGDVVGTYYGSVPDTGGTYQGFIFRDDVGWRPMGFIEVDGLQTSLVGVQGMNDRGEVLLLYLTSVYMPVGAIYRNDTGLVDLSEVIDPDSLPFADVTVMPIALNEAGQILIVGDGFDEDGNLVAHNFYAVLHPTIGAPADLVDFTFAFGHHLGGTLDDLRLSDDATLRGRSQFGFSATEPNVLELVTVAEATTDSVERIDLAFEGRLNNPGGNGALRLKNFATGNFEPVSQFPIGTGEITHAANDLDATNHVRASDGRIEVSTRIVVVATFSAFGFDAFIDQVRVTVE